MRRVLTVIEGAHQRASARCRRQGSRGMQERESSIPSSQREQPLHLPGGLNFDPPGSTCRRRFLSPKSSAGNAKRYALPLKRVGALSDKSEGARGGLRTRAGGDLVRLGCWVQRKLSPSGVPEAVLLACLIEVQ